MRTVARRLAPVVVAAVVLAPLVRDPGADSYPLSTYPMFASDQSAIADIATVVGVGADGAVRRLSPEAISGSDEVILAAATVAEAIRNGEADILCAEVAAREVAGDDVAFVVRTERIDAVAHVAEGAEPILVVEHARCEPSP